MQVPFSELNIEDVVPLDKDKLGQFFHLTDNLS